jgi:hypothetical protein
VSHASAAAPYGVGDLLADQVDPDGIARIAAEVLERAFEYPREVADVLAPHAHRFGCGRGDGPATYADSWPRSSRSRDERPSDSR